MAENEMIYFELKDSGDFIRIGLLKLNYPNAELDFDRNWIKSYVEVKAGGFSGQFECDLMTTDFERFKQSLSKLYNNLDGTASFTSYEGQVEIKIEGDGIGHFVADCSVMDNVGIGNQLDFEINFDQTIIPEMVRQLDCITKKFPVLGDI
jgi:hypothetical protein